MTWTDSDTLAAEADLREQADDARQETSSDDDEHMARQSREINRLHSELARMRPVYEAALAWRVGRDRNIVGTAPSGGQRSATGRALIEAVDKASEAGK